MNPQSGQPRFEAVLEQARRHAFVVPRCTDCGATFWHPRAHCPQCLSTQLEIIEPPGPARVYAYTRNHRPQGGTQAAPATLGYVEFDGGLRILARLDLPEGEDLTGIEVRPETRPGADGTEIVFVAVTP